VTRSQRIEYKVSGDVDLEAVASEKGGKTIMVM